MISIYIYIVNILQKRKEFKYLIFQRISTNIHSEEDEEQG